MSSEAKIKTEYAFTFSFTIDPPVGVGEVPTGNRVFINVSGGTVKGSGVDAVSLPGAGDWACLGPDGMGKLDVRAHVKDKDGSILYITYQGHLDGSNPGVAKLLGGSPDAKSTQFDEHLLMTHVNIETSSPKHAWVNRTIFVGKGRFEVSGGKAAVVYEVFKVT